MRNPTSTSRRPARSASNPLTPALQPLEPRLVMTALTWDGGGGDNLWSNPLNWSLNFVPRQADDVTIALAGPQRTIIADRPNTKVNSLTLDETLILNSGSTLASIGPFSLTQNADLRINGILNWAAGDWSTTKTVRINPGGTLNIGSSAIPGIGEVTLNSPLDNAGLLAWKGGSINLDALGSITNRAGKAFDIASPRTIAGTGSITNNGLLRRGGNSFETTTIDAPFNSSDRLYILRGTLELGQDASSPQASLAGRIALLDSTSVLHIFAPTTHADNIAFTGHGSLTFSNSDQTFLGDATLATTTVLFEGPSAGSEIEIIIDAASTLHVGSTTRLTLDLARLTMHAPLTIDGDAAFIDTIITDIGLPAHPALTLDGDFIASTLALAVNTTLTQPSSIEIGKQILGPGGAVISLAYTFTNNGLLTYNFGTLVLGVGAKLLNQPGATLVLTGPTVGGGPLSGSVVNRGTIFRRQGPTNAQTTSITGAFDSTGIVDVQEGVLNIANSLVQLPEVPLAEDTVLSAGTWRVRNAGRLNLPQPLERIGVNANVELFDLGTIPAMIAFRENRGLLRLTGTGGTHTGQGPTIVNKGTIQMEGDLFALRVFATPIEQRPSGRIIIKNGTLQFHGLSGNTRDFANPGLIRVESGTLSLDLDEGAQVGSFLNTGTLDLRKDGRVNIDGAFSTTGIFLTEIALAARGNVTSTRTANIDGTLTATYTGTGFFKGFSSIIILSGNFSLTGAFTTFNRLNVPTGLTPVLLTQFSASIRLD